MKQKTEETMETLVKRIAILPKKTLFLSALISGILALTACRDNNTLSVPYYTNASFSPVWDPGAGQVAGMHTIAPFSFTNQYGERITNARFKGKVYLVNFFFTSCPAVCPKLTRTMKLVYEKFKGNNAVQFVSHSVTPDIDSPERLYQYAQKNQMLSRQWQLLTGNKSAIYNLARKSYFIEEEMGLSKTSGQFLHTENFVLIDQQGHIRGLYNGTLEAEAPRITEDIRALLKK